MNTEPCWARCELCDDFVCNVHKGEHVADCGCPIIEDWYELDICPYESTVDELLEALKKAGRDLDSFKLKEEDDDSKN